MTTHTTVVLTDDLTGDDENVGNVEFALDGVTYEIDLGERNSANLRAVLADYVRAARRVPRQQARNGHAAARNGAGQPRPPDPNRPGPARADREQNRQMREWGRRNGWPQLGDRGRVPYALEEAYHRRAQP